MVKFTAAYLQPGTSTKKYKVTLLAADGSRKSVQFGAKGYSDFTKHKDEERKSRYVSRHKARENWARSGATTAGFWARWLLWNKPSLTSSMADIKRRFGIKVRRGAPPK